MWSKDLGMRTNHEWICENCNEPYWPTYPYQRFCNQFCREEFKNAELRAARRLWRQAGRPSLEKVVEQELNERREQHHDAA
jgi:hypothetical protein